MGLKRGSGSKAAAPKRPGGEDETRHQGTARAPGQRGSEELRTAYECPIHKLPVVWLGTLRRQAGQQAERLGLGVARYVREFIR